jgi:hypothetical protein
MQLMRRAESAARRRSTAGLMIGGRMVRSIAIPTVAARRYPSGADHGADRFRHRSRVPDVRPELLRLAKRGTNNNCQPAVRSRCLVPR